MANLRKWSTIIWLAVIAALVAYSIYRQPISVELLRERISFSMVGISLALIVVGKLLTVALVWFSLRFAGEDRGWKFAWRAYSLADISKYLPGGIWGVAGRLAIYKQDGIGLAKSIRLLLTETGVIIIFSLVTGGVAWTLSQSAADIPAMVGGLVVLTGTLFLAAMIAFPQLPIVLRCLVTLTTASSWIAFGLSFAIVAAPKTEQFLEFSGRHNLGFAAGQLAIFAPSGIGVREFVISWLSTNPSEDMRLIIEYVVIHRLIWIVADVIVLMPILFLAPSRKKTAEKIAVPNQ
jgi:glycosyltransferase 2 family protein